MPCLSARFNPAIGPLININIGVTPSGTFSPTMTQPVALTTFSALIDTGATSTCISPAVAQSLSLSAIGMQPMISANQSAPTNVYLVDLVLPFGAGGFVEAGMSVLEFSPPAASPFQMLLGRDILCQGHFSLSFDGHYTFSI